MYFKIVSVGGLSLYYYVFASMYDVALGEGGERNWCCDKYYNALINPKDMKA